MINHAKIGLRQVRIESCDGLYRRALNLYFTGEEPGLEALLAMSRQTACYIHDAEKEICDELSHPRLAEYHQAAVRVDNVPIQVFWLSQFSAYIRKRI